MLKEEFGVSVSFETMKKWMAQLLKKDLVSKFDYEKTYWATFYIDGRKERIMVTGDEGMEQGMRDYYKRRKQLVQEYRQNAYTAGREDFEAINSEAWVFTFKKLWEEFQCCYYACGSFYLNGLGEYAQEICELVEEITAGRRIVKPSYSPFGTSTNDKILF